MKIKGIKKAVGEYKRANAGGHYSPRYGVLMFDYSDGEVWTDEFYSLGHNSWKEYHSESIVNLSNMMSEKNIEITMANVKEFIKSHFDGFAD